MNYLGGCIMYIQLSEIPLSPSGKPEELSGGLKLQKQILFLMVLS